MDALSDVLRVVGLTGGIFLEARFTAPWCITAQIGPEQCRPFMTAPEYVLCFHYVVQGECMVAVSGSPPLTLTAGDIVLLPHNGAHKLGSQVDIPAVDAGPLISPPDGLGLKRIDYGGGGTECAMVCGFLGGDGQLEPLIATLPPLMKIAVRETPGAEWIAQSFRYGARQAAEGDPGAATIMSKISELLFVEAVRRYLVTMPEDHTGFLAGMRDPAIGKALSLLHTQVARDWTAEDLANAVNMSRSAFAEKFAALVGQPPIKYLTNWRMQIAAHKLREGKLSIAQIAFDTGYESEAAFTRAFKRELGVPPATWRRRVTQGNGVSASVSG
ncbi:MAG: helix-turn-helix domain-containing protein [Alphaproteobacteria bacterium]|nr:helix-turn-helix domain-containing protein [Alphaproteobacteria bacterium]